MAVKSESACQPFNDIMDMEQPDGLPLVASTGNAIGYAMESKQRVADTDENTL